MPKKKQAAAAGAKKSCKQAAAAGAKKSSEQAAGQSGPNDDRCPVPGCGVPCGDVPAVAYCSKACQAYCRYKQAAAQSDPNEDILAPLLRTCARITGSEQAAAQSGPNDDIFAPLLRTCARITGSEQAAAQSAPNDDRCPVPGCGVPCGDVAAEGLKKCSRCQRVAYCSKGCQTAAWPEHKKECKHHVPGVDTWHSTAPSNSDEAKAVRLNNGQCFDFEEPVIKTSSSGVQLWKGMHDFDGFKFECLEIFGNSEEADCASKLYALWDTCAEQGIKYRKHDVNPMKLGVMELQFKEAARRCVESAIIRISNLPGVHKDQCRNLSAQQIEAIADWHVDLVRDVRQVMDLSSVKREPGAGPMPEAKAFVCSCIEALPKGSRLVFNLWFDYEVACARKKSAEFLEEERFTQFKGPDDVWFWMGAPDALDSDDDEFLVQDQHVHDEFVVEDQHVKEALREFRKAVKRKEGAKPLSDFRLVRGFGKPLLGSTKFLQQRFSFRVV